MTANDKDDHNKHKLPNMLMIWLVWLLFSIAVVALSWSTVHQAILDSGVMEYLNQEQSESQPSSRQRLVSVYFIKYPETYTMFTQRQDRLGGSAYHDTFENLLKGPGEEALLAGAATYIHGQTKLRGITLSNKILYVDLSSEFANSENLQKAMQQLKQTALHFQGVKDIVTLVEGTVFKPEET